jgi:hypothetical protein
MMRAMQLPGGTLALISASATCSTFYTQEEHRQLLAHANVVQRLFQACSMACVRDAAAEGHAGTHQRFSHLQQGDTTDHRQLLVHAKMSQACVKHAAWRT